MSRPNAIQQFESTIDRFVTLFVRADSFENEDELWFAKSAFIYTYIGAFVALSYAIFYWFFQSYSASVSLGILFCVLVGTTPMHLLGKSRTLAKINLASTSIGLAGVVLHMGGVDSSAACWLLGVTPGVTALLFRRAKEIFQLTALTLCLYFAIFLIELSGYQVYRFSYPEGSVFERVYTFIHFTAFCIFIAVALAIFATTQRKLLRQVKRQAREVKAILANIQQGIFTITSPDLELGAEYSNYLEKIIEHKDIRGRSAMNVVFERSDLNNEQKDLITHIMANCIEESPLNFMVNEDNLVRNMTYRTADGREKILLVDWQPIVNERHECIEKVLVTLSDVTEFKRMEKQNSQQQRQIEIITEITEISPDKFDRFMQSASKFLEENRRISEASSNADDVKILFINMHTLKGAARTYHFKHMTAVIHDCEQYYAQVQRGERVWNRSEASANLKTVHEVFSEYGSISQNRLRRGDSAAHMKIDLETVRENIRLLQKIEGYALDDRLTPFVDHVKQTFYGLYYMDIDSLFQEICRPLASLAKDLEKPPPHVHFKSVNAGLTGDGCEIMRNVFIHIFRNSMDHGIERPDLRLPKGKPAEGTITIDITVGADEALHIRYSDDGQGLLLDRIFAISVQKGLLSPNEKRLSAIADTIFHSGFSTAKSVTDISGRGVGMGAVREFLSQAGGHIELILRSQSGRIEATPFQFLLVLPKQYYTLYQFDKNVA